MKKSKVILGLKHPSAFTLEERKLIVEEYLRTGCKKRDIWEKYTGERIEKGRLLRWMRQLGYDIPPKWSKLAHQNSASMPKSKPDKSNESAQMKERIEQLEKALVHSELRATALETMIEVAEKELKINIKKKSYTKQSSK
jgi:transposase